MSPISFIFHTTALPSRAQSNRSRQKLVCTKGPPGEDYQRAELLDDNEASASMGVWNTVIHASLKRKLQNLAAETPVVNGVSALLNRAPGQVGNIVLTTEDDDARKETVSNVSGMTCPDNVVTFLLEAFKRDGLSGASAFVSLASGKCRVRSTSPHTLVLFVGDNESYRPLLRVTSFVCAAPRYEAGGQECVVTAEVHSPCVVEEVAKFDFQLSVDEHGSWLIDEVFRL